MLRPAWNILCAISLVLCLVLTWMWFRSARVADVVEDLQRTDDGAAVRFTELRSERGTLIFSLGRSQFVTPVSPPPPSGIRVSRQPLGVVDAAAVRQTFTQGWIRVDAFNVSYTLPRRPPIQYRVTRRGVTLPDGVLAALLAIPPARWARVAFRRRRRARLGLCLCCGYDLRASAERCPECGSPPSPAAAGTYLPSASTR